MIKVTTITKWLKRIGLVLFSLVLCVILYGLFAEIPGQKVTPSGELRNSSHYITMRDGAKIAVDIWLPENLNVGQKIPALIRTTRYIRAMKSGFLRRLALGLGLENIHPIMTLFNEAGYALVLVDARGSGASSGKRLSEISPDEVKDMAEVSDWLIQQSWSNGKLGAFGVSYVGTTSEMLTGNQHPAVKVVMPLFSDFDIYTGLIRPGGVQASAFVREWGLGNKYSDNNDPCQGQGGFECLLTKAWFSGIKPVDSEPDLLENILKERDNYDIEQAISIMSHVDDSYNGITVRDSSPAGHQKEISASGVAMQIWVGWLDAATVDGALGRFNSFSNPQQVYIAPFNHGGGKNADPYRPVDEAVEPNLFQQYKDRVSYLDRFLKDDDLPLQKSEIHYFTMGENVWKTTDVWPPENMGTQRLYMGQGFSLTKSMPKEETAHDRYEVDFTASTGSRNRWFANLGGGRDIIYDDRAEEDKKLLVYDSDPLEDDMEITGAPVVTLQVSSSHTSGAFHVYLEDVAPDGKVTYITEGILDVKHRKVSDEEPPFYQEGPYHSYLRKDAAPLIIDQVTEVKIGLITTSVMIKAGHHIRIAIAGHDGSVFERLPEKGQPVITLHRNKNNISYVDLPVALTR